MFHQDILILMKFVTEGLKALRWTLAITWETAWTEKLIFSIEKHWIYSTAEWKQNLTLQKLFQKTEVLFGGCPLVSKYTFNVYYHQEFIQDCIYTQTHTYVSVRNGRPKKRSQMDITWDYFMKNPIIHLAKSCRTSLHHR